MINEILHYDALITRRNLKAYNLIHGTNYTLDDLNIFTYLPKSDYKYPVNNVAYYGKVLYKESINNIDNNHINIYNTIIAKLKVVLSETIFYIFNHSDIICLEYNNITYGYLKLKYLELTISMDFTNMIANLSKQLSYFSPMLLILEQISKYLNCFNFSDKFFLAQYIPIIDSEAKRNYITKEDAIKLLHNSL